LREASPPTYFGTCGGQNYSLHLYKHVKNMSEQSRQAAISANIQYTRSKRQHEDNDSEKKNDPDNDYLDVNDCM
jgi:hypothetical protein